MPGKLSSSKIGSYEMAKVKGGVELHYGSNAIGEYVWWYGDDGKMYGYYTVYYA